MKWLCYLHNPLSMLMYLRDELNGENSIYYEYLEIFNFKSKYANLLMKRFQGNVIKLVILYGLCPNLVTGKTKEITKDVEDIATSILTLIQEQRKEVPNMLTSETIIKHFSDFKMPTCFSEETADFINYLDINIICSHKEDVSI